MCVLSFSLFLCLSLTSASRIESLCSPAWPQTCDPLVSESKHWNYRCELLCFSGGEKFDVLPSINTAATVSSELLMKTTGFSIGSIKKDTIDEMSIMRTQQIDVSSRIK